MIQKNAERNLAIFASYNEGAKPRDLARHYALALVTVKQIINAQKHLQAVSAESAHRTARGEFLFAEYPSPRYRCLSKYVLD